MTAEPGRTHRFSLAEESRPLGMIQVSSNRLNQSFSIALSAAADNLLTKALHRLENGQEEQARGLIQRALHLPFDEHEEVRPALWSAHMALFISISDDLDEAEPGDERWLDRAEALIGLLGPTADAEVRSCLRSFLSDVYSLSPSEARRLKALTAGVPFNAEPLAGTPDDEPAHIEAITDLLKTVVAHRHLLDAG